MAAPPFKVKAIYAYDSPHEDDLSFPEGQVITVTEEEDDEWYVGEYTDTSGAAQNGLFPKNFVEKFEPQAPPRPTRSRPKAAEAPAPVSEVYADPEPPESQPVQTEASRTREPAPAPAPAPAPVSKPTATEPEPPPAPKPAAAVPAAKQPPPVSAKPSSFKDRIAAFNQPAAAPVAPFKPGGSSSQTFIKKPFVAPPPSRNAYVPPTQSKPEPHKIYRREEDPEIAEQQAEAEQAAERAGLGGVPGMAAPAADNAESEDAPKMSLKERIAALQKQQAEQAQRRADAGQKKKPERPPKKRVESHEVPEEGAGLEKVASGETERPSVDVPREQVHRPSHGAETHEPFSDGGNDADMSAAGETTEDAGASSTSIDEDEEAKRRHSVAAAHEPELGEGDREEEEDEDEEMDDESRRQQALRERMAKLSGGMGMAGMFGPPGGMPQPGMSGGARKKKPADDGRPAEEDGVPEQTSQHPGVRMVPIPGMGRPPAAPKVEREDEEQPSATASHAPEEVADVEDAVKPVTRRSTDRSAPPVPGDRPVPMPPPATDRGAPPPLPGERPGRASLDGKFTMFSHFGQLLIETARAAPPPLPPANIMSPTEGSESDDEAPETSVEDLPIRSPPNTTRPAEPRLPPQSPPLRGAPPPVPMSPRSPTQERGPPPLPPSSSRAPPPLPPSGPPARQPTGDLGTHRADGAEGESEYEGDYDTDIASSAKHKDALKHTRGDSLDETTADEASIQSPQIPQAVPQMPGASRAAPPPPPHSSLDRRSTEIKRQSMGSPRAPPPVPVARKTTDMEDDEYDPYRYSMGGVPPPGVAPHQPAGPRQVPPPPAGGAPQLPALPSVTAPEPEEDGEEVYRPPKRASTDRARPPPGPPPPPQERGAPAPPPQFPIHPSSIPLMPGTAPSRRSMDPDSMASRRSTDIPRPSHDGGFIAQDIDLGKSSYWWAQPNLPPPALQNKRDMLFEIEEDTSSKSGTVIKTVYVLYQDYSQSVVIAQYNAADPSKVSLEQRQERPPERLRQDQLEDAHTRFGRHLNTLVAKAEGNVIGDGSSQVLVLDLLSQLKGALFPVGTRAYGALVYQNIGNATIQQFDEIRPGDVVSFRNAKFSGKHGSLHTKYSQEVGKPDHVAIVAEWDGTKKKVRGWEQGRDSEGEPGEEGSKPKGKGKGGKIKVKQQSFRLDDLRSGEVRVWRVMPRSWVGWDDAGAA